MVSTIGLLTKEAMEYFYYIFEDYEAAGTKKKIDLKIRKVFPKFDVKSKPSDPVAFLEEYKQQLLKVRLPYGQIGIRN